MQNSCKVIIKHEKGIKEYTVRKGSGFQALSAKHETPIEYSCRKADCGICIFKVVKGAEKLSPPTPKELDFLKAMRAEKEERLACQCNILGDVSIFLDS